LKNKNVTKAHISSAFSRGAEIRAPNRAHANIFTAASRKRARRALKNAAQRGSGGQNQVESLLFFSCCSNRDVVQLDSRLHCTYTAIHSTRSAAMAKKRKKAAAKKKTTKRRKKK
jgi:hypothetical protein